MEAEKMSWSAYQIIQRVDGKKFWRRIGGAFLNRDNSINVLLDALPIDGKIQLRYQNSKKEEKGGEQQ